MAKPQEIALGVYWLRISIANIYYVRSGSGWALIDTAVPNQAATIRAGAESVFGPGAKPNAILLTHGHFDHSGSAVELARLWNVPVYLGRGEFPFIDGTRTYPLPDRSVGGFMSFMMRIIPLRKRL